MADDKIQQAAQQVQERAVPAVKDVTDGTVRPAADRAAAQVTLPQPPVNKPRTHTSPCMKE